MSNCSWPRRRRCAGTAPGHHKSLCFSMFQSHQTLTLPNVLWAIVGHFHFLCSFFKSQAEPLNLKWPSMKRKHPLPSNFLLSGVCLKCLRGTKKQAWKSKCAPRKCCNLNNHLAEVFCVERLHPGQALVWHGLIEVDRGWSRLIGAMEKFASIKARHKDTIAEFNFWHNCNANARFASAFLTNAPGLVCSVLGRHP